MPAYMYFGTGDTGGSPDSLSVDWLEKSIESDGPLAVQSIGADDLVDMVDAQSGCAAAALQWRTADDPPRRRVLHFSGGHETLESQERTAGRCHRAGLGDRRMLGGLTYPKRRRSSETWIRFLWHQFHDDLTGTSIPEAYRFSWNDEILCQNRFAECWKTRSEPRPRCSTPASRECRWSCSIRWRLPARMWSKPRSLFDGQSASSHAGVRSRRQRSAVADRPELSVTACAVAFVAKVPSVGYAVYDVRPDKKPCDINTGLEVASDTTLENQRYLVKLNEQGDVVSISDKIEKRELLTAPIRLNCSTTNRNSGRPGKSNTKISLRAAGVCRWQRGNQSDRKRPGAGRGGSDSPHRQSTFRTVIRLRGAAAIASNSTTKSIGTRGRHFSKPHFRWQQRTKMSPMISVSARSSAASTRQEIRSAGAAVGRHDRARRRLWRRDAQRLQVRLGSSR